MSFGGDLHEALLCKCVICRWPMSEEMCDEMTSTSAAIFIKCSEEHNDVQKAFGNPNFLVVFR